jgi:hypothetical protein
MLGVALVLWLGPWSPGSARSIASSDDLTRPQACDQHLHLGEEALLTVFLPGRLDPHTSLCLSPHTGPFRMEVCSLDIISASEF